MTIFGDKDITKQFQLINPKQDDKGLFESGQTNEFEMELDDVGKVNRILFFKKKKECMICFFKINKINIGQDGKGLHPNWHLESVQIQKETENYKYTNLFIFFKFIFFLLLVFSQKKFSINQHHLSI